MRAAVRILLSDDIPAAPSQESPSALSEKHPKASSNLKDLAASCPEQHIAVDESDVCQAIRSFPAGSVGGPDGLDHQHIRDMMMCQEGNFEFLSALTAFVNLVLAGGCPLDVGPVFFGGRLLALNKK